MDQILGQVLRNAVWERLDMLADLATRADAQSLVSVARSELPRLTEGWRAMLTAHEPDERGDCPTCSTRWHRCKAPCSVWQVAHEHLVAGGLAPQRDLRRPWRRKTNPVPPQPRGTTPGESTGRHALMPQVANR
ncbi:MULTISPECIES: hypothetical protein [Amycolatopsis]|uniref:Uncharacterized protein n=1 Tax=Amycolatopsis thermalba TaxID=944492 RepID=A0ABY4NQE9_9PSEU|nr:MULTISPECIES: hypothetical protein [Amycolatopsis]OXM74470.1 hypothetical protein CF166_04720 [Amycolatopsis sp. KNN50.9b]UQS21842.1 hypothetical protein L1857_02890 [Amycolatopsis thermalba]